MRIKEILDAKEALFKFECQECKEIYYLSIFDILESGHPMCCDEEMEIDEGCYRQFK